MSERQNVYALVFAAGAQSFDTIAELTTEPMVTLGLEPLFLSNPHSVKEREVGDCDFDVCLFSHGQPVDSLDSEDREHDERSTLEHLVTLTTRMLRAVHDRVNYDTWQNANPDAAAPLARALDAWDDFVQAIEPEPGIPYPGIRWPADPDGFEPPEGWSWVERDDEADVYLDDEAAAIRLRGILGANVEVRWFDRRTLEPLDDYRSGASCAINVPEPEERR